MTVWSTGGKFSVSYFPSLHHHYYFHFSIFELGALFPLSPLDPEARVMLSHFTDGSLSDYFPL
jgi:hypothetical protein